MRLRTRPTSLGSQVGIATWLHVGVQPEVTASISTSLPHLLRTHEWAFSRLLDAFSTLGGFFGTVEDPNVGS